MHKRHMTQVEQKQANIDELIRTHKSATSKEGCALCDREHPTKSDENAILCRHKKSYVHESCCTTKCSWDGTPCRHAIKIHKKE